jgi:Co/Zn/Cd efflux system component
LSVFNQSCTFFLYTPYLEVLAGFANGVFLVFVSLLIVLESIERIMEPQEMSTENLMLVSVLGLIVNIAGLVACSEAHSHAHLGGAECTMGGHNHGESGGACSDDHGQDCRIASGCCHWIGYVDHTGCHQLSEKQSADAILDTSLTSDGYILTLQNNVSEKVMSTLCAGARRRSFCRPRARTSRWAATTARSSSWTPRAANTSIS